MSTAKETMSTPTRERLTCFHCGEACPDDKITIGDKYFCCNGCKTVYELLEANDMCSYYSLDEKPGVTPKEAGIAVKYQYLEEHDVRNKLINFTDGQQSNVTFYIPAMHCASCVWLLESLYRLTPVVISSQVDFLKKELSVTYKESPTALRELVELLASIGYEPEINLGTLDKKSELDDSRDLYIKIGVAGFSFANIMLLSFPHYLVGSGTIEPLIQKFFGVVMILLALPVFFYSAQDYFRSALQGWKQKHVNMDVPISIGILTLFIRSIVEILQGGSHGYMDSFAGLVFFLLIGTLFEKKTYATLSFDRDYKSYFPVSVTKKTNKGETTVSLEKLNVGDRIIVRNEELIPADSVLMSERAFIDYSFVTGESRRVEKQNGDIIFAGGKQVGSAIELEVIKKVNQSYLTQLWNDDAFTKQSSSRITSLANTISKYFTLIVLALALGSAIVWAPTSLTMSLNAFTAVLIVACPCALALSTPFTLGNTLRIFGRAKFYLKNTKVVEALAKINMIVFDKTGTLTHSRHQKVVFHPLEGGLDNEAKKAIGRLARQSTHPLSQQVAGFLGDPTAQPVADFKELAGRGVSGRINGHTFKLGSADFVGAADSLTTSVFVSRDDCLLGYFEFENEYRAGLKDVLTSLARKFPVHLLTGDGEKEKKNLLNYFPSEKVLHFNQLPISKLDFIKNKQRQGHRVLMVGDGLNDAGALKQSDVGISLSEDINAFSPASDAILDASRFHRLGDFLAFSRTSMRIIKASFVISFFYNVVGLSCAMSGTLSPLIAAILMPSSSITVVLFTTGMTTLLAKKRGLLQ